MIRNCSFDAPFFGRLLVWKKHRLKWLCNHLGHTSIVHETHYRATSGLIERVEIAKLLLLQENNVRGTATCTECMKSRCIYAKSKLTTREERSLKHTLENIDYTCGSLITPNGMIEIWYDYYECKGFNDKPCLKVASAFNSL